MTEDDLRRQFSEFRSSTMPRPPVKDFYNLTQRRYQQRRWMITVLLMVALLCAGLGLAVPAAWLLDYTDRQGDPQPAVSRLR